MNNFKKRVTIYFDPDLQRALQKKAAETGESISELVNQAVKLSLSEDAEDLAAFEERRHEPDLALEDVLKDLKLREDR
jgi:predicted transcriptional regulator